ncbi:MAG: hypothetical protein R3E96_12300 [Planctomycetota bacterium]
MHGFEPGDLLNRAGDLWLLAQNGRHHSVRLAAMAGLLQGNLADNIFASCSEKGDLLCLYLDAIALLAGQNPGGPAAEATQDIDQPLADPGRGTGDGGNKVGPARFVRIDLPGRAPLTLAEVEVLSAGENIARGGTASQSSVAWGGVAEHAIDGNTDPSYGGGSQATPPSRSSIPGGNSTWARTTGRADPHLEPQGRRTRQAPRWLSPSLLDANRRKVWDQAENPAPDRMVEHTLAIDWAARIDRAGLRALNALGAKPKASAGAIANRLARVPVDQHAADWYKAGLALIDRAGVTLGSEASPILRLTLTAGATGFAPTRLEVPPAPKSNSP